MQTVGTNLTNVLSRHPLRGRRLNWVFEIYSPTVIGTGTNQICDMTTADAPAYALARWSESCITWNGYQYLPRIFGDPGTVKRFFGRENNNLTIKLGNINLYGTRFILAQRVEGLYCVLRLISPDAGNDYAILYTGRFKRPGGVDHKEVTLPIQQYYGGLEQEAPARTYSPTCPLDFAQGDCLGDQLLTEKSAAFQTAFAASGESGCNKTFSRCTSFGNNLSGRPQTDYYQGINLVKVTGTFQYPEKVKTKFLFFFTRTKKVTHTVQYSSRQDENIDEAIGLGWGRVSVGPLHTLQSVDRGTEIDTTAAILQGPIEKMLSLTVNTQGLTIKNSDFHPGAYGGQSGQTGDPRFPNSSPLSKLAYVGVTTTGSAVEQQDDSPELSAVVLARRIKIPAADGTLTREVADDNPVWVLRDMYTDPKLGRIPECLIDDDVAKVTAQACNRLIIDTSNGDIALVPRNELGNDVNTGNYHSTGTTIRFLGAELTIPDGNITNNNDVSAPPTTIYFDPDNPPTSIPGTQVLRRRFTFNGVLNQVAKLTDYINRSLLPVARLFTMTGANGKLQIRQEDKVDNTYTRQATSASVSALPVTNVLPWLLNRTGYLIIGVGTTRSEIAIVKNVRFSTAGNAVPITVTATGGLTATVSSATLLGGTEATPASARITMGGTPGAAAQVVVKIEDTTVSYVTPGNIDMRTVIASVAAYINAHPNLAEIVSADWDDSGITVRSLLGFLDLDRTLTNSHNEGEENIRVAYVFDNCGGTFRDNILKDSFRWNTDRNNDKNLVVGTFTSAVDGFIRWELRRRARAHIDYVGHESKEDMDLQAIDNYGQAAEITKCKLITLRDCDIWFEWKSAAGMAMLLEEGDVVAVRHRSGELAVNYAPVRIREFSAARDVTSFVAQLYLTAAYLPDVAPKDLLLPTSVTPNTNGTGTTTVNGSGGTGYVDNTGCKYQPGGDNYYGNGFNSDGTYSPCGTDIV